MEVFITLKTTGIIVEYNPLHPGHIYHMEQTRKQTGADYLIAVMSGSFVQRGAPALLDKYTRTRMALLAGADVVIELPVCFATGSAGDFAAGAVSLLDIWRSWTSSAAWTVFALAANPATFPYLKKRQLCCSANLLLFPML